MPNDRPVQYVGFKPSEEEQLQALIDAFPLNMSLRKLIKSSDHTGGVVSGDLDEPGLCDVSLGVREIGDPRGLWTVQHEFFHAHHQWRWVDTFGTTDVPWATRVPTHHAFQMWTEFDAARGAGPSCTAPEKLAQLVERWAAHEDVPVGAGAEPGCGLVNLASSYFADVGYFYAADSASLEKWAFNHPRKAAATQALLEFLTSFSPWDQGLDPLHSRIKDHVARGDEVLVFFGSVAAR